MSRTDFCHCSCLSLRKGLQLLLLLILFFRYLNSRLIRHWLQFDKNQCPTDNVDVEDSDVVEVVEVISDVVAVAEVKSVDKKK